MATGNTISICLLTIRRMVWIAVGCMAWCVHSYAQLTYKDLTVLYDSAWTYQNLQLIPIRFKHKEPQPDFPAITIGLEQAMRTGKVQVREFFFNGDASVGVLAVRNKSNQPILLHSGDILTGGKQDRMVAESKLLMPKSEEEFVNVYCIERGRWDKKAKPFTYAGSADAGLRKVMDSSGNQAAIWKEIERHLPPAAAGSTTWPYAHVYNSVGKADTAYLHFFTRKMATTDSLFAGFIAVTDTGIIGCELFQAPSLLLASYDAMLQGWIHTVLMKGNKPVVLPGKLHQFADDLLLSEEQQKFFVQLHGKAWYFNKKIFHIVIHSW